MTTPLTQVQEKIHAACKRSGRAPQDVTLIAVSKTWSADEISPLILEGQLSFGENKLQELEQKAPALPEKLEWHFIGGLQRNKVRKVLQHAQVIHSIDSKKLLDAVDRIAGEEGLLPQVFLQVNLEGEGTKGGIAPADCLELVRHTQGLQNLRLTGLMCIPRFQEDPEDVRPSFRQLKELRDQVQEGTSHPLPHLSMGMSHDYHVAVEEGATHIRVGSALFGKRPPLNPPA